MTNRTIYFKKGTTIRPHRLVVRTSASHAGNTGSNPVGVTKREQKELSAVA